MPLLGRSVQTRKNSHGKDSSILGIYLECNKSMNNDFVCFYFLNELLI